MVTARRMLSVVLALRLWIVQRRTDTVPQKPNCEN
jgi:hypothetical protein